MGIVGQSPPTMYMYSDSESESVPAVASCKHSQCQLYVSNMLWTGAVGRRSYGKVQVTCTCRRKSVLPKSL